MKILKMRLMIKRKIMSSCRNCGHESHCGNVLKKDLEGGGEEIEVCTRCRCERCESEDTISKS